MRQKFRKWYTIFIYVNSGPAAAAAPLRSDPIRSSPWVMSSNISYSSPSPSLTLSLCASFAIIFIIAELWKNRWTAFFYIICCLSYKEWQKQTLKSAHKNANILQGFFPCGSLSSFFFLRSFLLSFTKINWFFFRVFQQYFFDTF